MAIVRRARPEDAAALAEIHIAAWRGAYRGVMSDAFLDGLDVAQWTERWRQTLTRAAPALAPEAVLIVEREAGRPAGFAITGPERPLSPHSGSRGELWAINVAPEAWGKGLGYALLTAAQEALAHAGHREAVLWVIAANERARRFYERAGWAADGVEKREARLGFELHEVRYACRLPTPPLATSP